MRPRQRFETDLIELNPTDDQALFRETTERFLADTSPITAVRDLEHDRDGFDPAWWQRGAELGWTSMLAPESLGGGGISDSALDDLALTAYEFGRMVSPGPLVPTNVVIAMLTDADHGSNDHEALVLQLMAGTATAAIAIDEPGRSWGAAGIQTTARATNGQLLLSGTKAPVEAGAQAAALIVSARDDHGEPLLILMNTGDDGVTISERNSIDLVRRYATLQLTDVAVDLSAVVARGAPAIDRCLDLANVLQMAETVGALDRVFEFTLEWAFDRYTFGRPLASYQELKHRFADMKLWLEASKATIMAAVNAVSEQTDDASELVSVAKSYVSINAPELVQDCVQMHGGIGVTWDHDIHLYLRRVTLNSATYGTVGDHRKRLAAIVLAKG